MSDTALQPGGEAWRRIMSPSKAAAVLGVSRYESAYRLWHRMKGLVDPEEPKDIFVTGHAMELALAYLWREENPGWQLSPGEVQVKHDRFGFPVVVHLDRRARRGSGRKKVIEFKSARSLEEWGDHFTDQAPADYLVQVVAQQHFTGYTEHPAHLMVMGPYLQHHTYVIEYDAELGAHIEAECRKFMDSLAGDTPPVLDDSIPTFECVKDLHPDIVDRDAELDMQDAIEFLEAEAGYKAAEKRRRGIRTRVLARMGDAKVARCQTKKIADRRPNAYGSVSLYAAKTNPEDLIGDEEA